MSFNLTNNVKQQKDLQLRSYLLQCVEQEKEQIEQALDTFYQQAYQSPQLCEKMAREIIDMITRLEQAGAWDDSPFLQNLIKPYRQMREELTQLLQQSALDSEVTDKPVVAKAGYRLIYVSLYQSQGRDLEKWLRMLKTLFAYTLSRPVYTQEAPIQEIMRAKVGQSTYAYAIGQVKEEDVLSTAEGERRKDQFGNELLVLAKDAVCFENLIEFVHLKKRYNITKKVLKLKEIETD